ncbi:MAG: Kazal-type serine protease inhibitor family protein [archaeon]
MRLIIITMLAFLLVLSACNPPIGIPDLQTKDTITWDPNTPVACTADWSPVCGVDGTTYANECMAGDVDIAYEGECGENILLSEEEARLIAEEKCDGVLQEGEGNYNHNSKTWWFGITPTEEHPNCNPACVVWVETGEAEINWMCLGALPPIEIPDDCISWFDGCNWCGVENGAIGMCTERYCEPEAMEEPKCLQFKYVEAKGTVKYVDVEGGCWRIEGSDGKNYEPIGLIEEYRYDGLKVEFKGTVRTDLATTCMVGTLIEITEIKVNECVTNEDCEDKADCVQPEDNLCFSIPFCNDGECRCVQGCQTS